MVLLSVYITAGSEREAERITKRLLEKRLVACVNFLPAKSSYWWKGKLVNAKEVVLVAKTRKGNWEKIRSEVKKAHSYSVPCITAHEVKAGKDYEEWVLGETKT
ncbi:MAG TPA: divalent-cation tolerance protein CutA [archaeon]|nr:divalent-cation tolerance protein CutA [archaeon]